MGIMFNGGVNIETFPAYFVDVLFYLPYLSWGFNDVSSFLASHCGGAINVTLQS